MTQDKLEEIARLLGGISDKLDVVVGSLTAEQRLDVKEQMEKLARRREEARSREILNIPLGYAPLTEAGRAALVEQFRRRWDGDGLASETADPHKQGSEMVGGTTIVVGML